MHTATHIAEQLQSHYLFSHLSPTKLNQLTKRVRLIHLERGERLFNHNEPAERFFLLVKGLVKLFRSNAAGEEKVVDVIQPNKTFAEAVMFMEQRSYPVSAEALQKTQLLAIPNQVYLQLLKDDHQSCLRLLGNLSQRLHRRLTEIEDLTLQSATNRLARYLLRLIPEDADNGTCLRLPAPKQVIASKLAIEPETFSRALKKLSSAELIRVETATVIILDVQGLYGQASQ
ncbi:Crp/Fnr family transcriptional regulator [Alkalilimnicola ehrlichii]|uniref:Crp/Fnr family transcriptional regulator n=1 Tax=Alkalilimnicola ehrlichii TaxID=351052 RepID=UPI0015F29B06|nr:Crp/Fnr family transcriptional regulator [Alkalilimnicola ehrlichii]